MERIDNWDEYFMRMAYLVALRSHDPRTKIGSVLVRERAVIATGYNSFPRGFTDSIERYANKEMKREMVSHSEENTILTSARLGICTAGSVLYTSGVPCHRCAKAIVQGGISEVIIHKQWPDQCDHPSWITSFKLTKMLFDEAKVSLRIFDKPLGIKGLLDGEEITV